MTTFAFTNWSFGYFISGFFIIVIAIFLFLKKRDDQVVLLLSLGCFLAAIACFVTGILVSTVSVGLWRILAYMYFSFELVGITLVFHFSQLFRRKQKIMEHKKVMLIYILPLFFILAIIVQPSLLTADIQNMENNLDDHILPGTAGSIVGSFFQFYLIFIIIATFVNCIRMFRQKEDLELRRQGSYFVFSYFFIFIGNIFMNFFKYVLGTPILVSVPLLLMPVTMSIIAYGIIKENLFDIDLIIKRSIQYSLVTFALTGVFFLAEKLLESVVQIEVMGQTKLSGLISAGVVVISSMPLKSIGKKLTEKWFPDVKIEDPLEAQKKRDLEIYEKLLRDVLAGGSIEWNEKRLLARLRKEYEIKYIVHKILVVKLKKELKEKKEEEDEDYDDEGEEEGEEFEKEDEGEDEGDDEDDDEVDVDDEGEEEFGDEDEGDDEEDEVDEDDEEEDYEDEMDGDGVSDETSGGPGMGPVLEVETVGVQCPKCNAVVRDGDVFCMECGTRMDEAGNGLNIIEPVEEEITSIPAPPPEDTPNDIQSDIESS